MHFGSGCGMFGLDFAPPGVFCKQVTENPPRLWHTENREIILENTRRRLRAAGSDLAIIFATTSQEHGLESFELQVMDYLVKPVGQAAVDQAMDWFVGQEAARLRLLRVGTEGEEDAETVRVGEVDYIEICRHTAVVRAAGRVYEVRRTMDALEEELNDSRFFRCPRRCPFRLGR